MTREQSSSYIKNVCALRQSPNTISLLSGHGAFSLQTATLSQGRSQTRLSSPRTQQGGQGSSLAPHTLWQLLLSPHLLSPSHSAAFLLSSLPHEGSAGDAAAGSELLGQAFAWSCEGHGRGLGHSIIPQLLQRQLRAQRQQNTIMLGLCSKKKWRNEQFQWRNETINEQVQYDCPGGYFTGYAPLLNTFPLYGDEGCKPVWEKSSTLKLMPPSASERFAFCSFLTLCLGTLCSHRTRDSFCVTGWPWWQTRFLISSFLNIFCC